MQNNKLGKSNLEVSRIGLGTVEIGIPGYGVGKKDFISEKDAITLLKSAVDLGITYIDTARGYGLSEERIGKANIRTTEGVVVGTKCGQFISSDLSMSNTDMEKKIREEIDESRRLLGYETLPLVQLHIEDEKYIDLNLVIEIMSKLKNEEKVSHVGIASRGFDVPRVAIESGFFETIQVAYSILDQRMSSPSKSSDESETSGGAQKEYEDILTLAQINNVGVINRSVLLKGVLTPAREHLPLELSQLKAQADAAAAIADELGIDLPSLAIRFSLSNQAVSTSLIGTTKAKRISQAMEAVSAGPLDTATLDKLYALGITDPLLVDPSKWPK